MPSTSQPTPPVLVKRQSESWSQTCSYGSCTPMSYSKNTNGTTLFSTGLTSRDWTRTAGFRALKKSGKRLPENPFSRVSYDCDASSLAVMEYGSRWADHLGNSTFSRSRVEMSLRQLYSNPTSVNQGIITDSAIAVKLLDKIKDAEWQAPVFVAEAKKSLEMILGTAKTVTSVIRNLKRGRIDKAFRELGLTQNKRITKRYNQERFKDPSKAAANAWLQMKYGWIPLLMDAKSAAETIAEIVAKDRDLPLTTRVSLSRKIETISSVPFGGQWVGDGTIRLDMTTVVSKRLLVTYKVNPADVPGSLGLLNPLSVIWELVPLSFVADWFLPIGDYLQHLDANLRYTFLSGLASFKGEIVGKATLGSSNSGAYQVGPGDNFTVRVTNATRLGALPTPSVKDIKFHPELGVQRLISGIALLRQGALSAFKIRH